jgi:hypothetical protein
MASAVSRRAVDHNAVLANHDRSAPLSRLTMYLPMLLKGAQAFLQRPQHRLGYIRRQTLFILGCDDLALAGDTVQAIGDEPISLG